MCTTTSQCSINYYINSTEYRSDSRTLRFPGNVHYKYTQLLTENTVNLLKISWNKFLLFYYYRTVTAFSEGSRMKQSGRYKLEIFNLNFIYFSYSGDSANSFSFEVNLPSLTIYADILKNVQKFLKMYFWLLLGF